jgi:benzoyl-CoA reductase/2-hydroxyglutaryl-CoA dehydratase subunit BcrC/BadD/HgdB
LIYFKEQLQGLVTHLDRYFGVRITSERLARAVEAANTTRDLLKRLLALQNRGDPPWGHADIVDILSAGFRSSREPFNAAQAQLVHGLEEEGERPSGGLKVLVSGSALDGSVLIRMVEELREPPIFVWGAGFWRRWLCLPTL